MQVSSVCDLYREEAQLGMQVLKFEIYVLFQDRENIRRQHADWGSGAEGA